jgi:hypothetical protein
MTVNGSFTSAARAGFISFFSGRFSRFPGICNNGALTHEAAHAIAGHNKSLTSPRGFDANAKD